MAGAHSSLSASKTKEWGNCAAVIPMAELFGRDSPSGRAAQMGTCVHALIERCLAEGVAPSTYLDRVAEVLNPDTDREGVSILKRGAKMPTGVDRVVFLLDAELVEAATHMADYVVGRLVELFPDTYRAEDGYAVTQAAVAAGHLRLESRTNPLPHRDDTGGTADVTIDAWPVVLEVVDYKNGSGVYVPVRGNPQLRTYVLGRAVEASPDLGDYASYRAAVCQPRHHQAPQPDGVSYEELSATELGEFRSWLDAAASRVDGARECVSGAAAQKSMAFEGGAAERDDLTPEEALEVLHRNGYVTTGEDGAHCTWCDMLAVCPAAKARAQETARSDFLEDEVPADAKAVKARVEEDVSTMGAKSLAQVLPWLPFLSKYAAAVELRARTLLASGGEVPGWKLVQTSGNRTWRSDLSESELVERLTSEYGVERSQLFSAPVPPKLLSGPKVEKLLPSKRRKEFSDALLYKPVGGVDMVPEADGRPAYVPAADAAADFEGVEYDGE